MTVYLVGAGPGDPGLLTRRAEEVLRRAEVVVHDRLIDPAVLDLAPAIAQRIDAGRRPGADAEGGTHPDTRQEWINALLVEHGRRGATVVRLKGGDPFVLGRGGEEAEALVAAGVDFEVVPGVSSALAVPAVAGVPVTHRALSGAVTVVTGHAGDPEAPAAVDWEALARTNGTLVVLMGVANRAEIARRLVAGGRAPDTPVAVTEWGTTPRARTVRTTLDQLAEVPVASPAVIVVGPVAALALVPPRPLAGWSVAVTRPAAQAGRLARALADAGARVVAAPAVAVVDPVDGGAALRAAAARLGDYQWVAATSANAVRRLLAEVPDARAFGAARLAAVGPATAAALAEGRLRADLVAAQSSGAALADDFPIAPDGGRVLFVKAEAARDSLPAGLAAKGWAVDEVVAYRTVPAPAPEGPVLEALSRADAVIFASPSAVAAWVGWRRTLGGPLPDPAEVVTVGPTTTTAAREAGLLVTAEAESPSDRALVEALVGRALARAGSEVGPDRPIGGPPPSGAPPPGTSASGPAPSSPA